MPIEMHPKPDIPERPNLPAAVLENLYASAVIDGNSTAVSRAAKQWLADMCKWAAWAAEYRERLDAFYIEHQALIHGRKVEAGSLADGWMLGAGEPMDNCAVCQYLTDQHRDNQIEERP